jgi:hypothetical protein
LTGRSGLWECQSGAAALRILVAVPLLFAFVEVAAAQEALRFHGRVVWVSGNTMVVAPDSGGSLNVDLRNVDQSSYETLQRGDGVTVVGTVSTDRTKLIAESVIPDQ